MNSSEIPVPELLEHADWVRRLAGSLMEDAARAEDLTQDVWLAVLEAAPSHRRNLRGWLRTTSRRMASHRRCRGRDRRGWERGAAVPEALPSTADLVERSAQQRLIAEVVTGLDEPLRRVLLLRYWEGLPPREIARRDGIPVETVKTRMQRAQTRVRERLDHEFGDTKSWCLAFAPWVEWGPGPAAWWLSSTALRNWLVGLLVGGGLVAAVATQWADSGSDLGGSRPSGLADESASTTNSSGDAFSSPVVIERRPDVATPGASPRNAEAVADGMATPRVLERQARVVDVNGQPVGDLRFRARGIHRVTWQGGDPVWIGNDVTTLRVSLEEQDRWPGDRRLLDELCRAQQHPREWSATLLGTPIPEREFQADAEGFVVDSRVHTADVIEPGWTLLAVGSREGPAERCAVASPAVDLRGVVTDIAGDPVAGAQVEFLRTPIRWFEGNSLREGGPPPCTTDDRGRFVLRDVPAHAEARWRVSSDSHEPWSDSVPAVSDPAVVVQLLPRGAATARLIGEVVDSQGLPVVDARVHCGRVKTTVNADGSYSLPVPRPRESDRLVVWAPGLRPFIEEGLGRELQAGAAVRVRRRIVLEPGLGTLFGSVVDERGVPVAGAEVGLYETAVLDGTLSSLAASVGGRSLRVSTDEDGRFRIGGLLESPVRLRVFTAEGAAAMKVTDPLPVDHDALVRLTRDDRARSVVGRVRQPDWMSIEAAVVTVGFDWLRTPDGDGAIFEESPGVPVDEEGRFELDEVIRTSTWIAVDTASTRYRFSVDELDLNGEVELDLAAATSVESRR